MLLLRSSEAVESLNQKKHRLIAGEGAEVLGGFSVSGVSLSWLERWSSRHRNLERIMLLAEHGHDNGLQATVYKDRVV